MLRRTGFPLHSPYRSLQVETVFLWLSRLSSQHPLNSLSLAWGCLNSFNHVKHLKTLCTLKEREEVSKGLLGRLGAKSWLSEWFAELAKASANFNRQLIGAVLKQCPQLADQMVAQLKPCMFFFGFPHLVGLSIYLQSRRLTVSIIFRHVIQTQFSCLEQFESWAQGVRLTATFCNMFSRHLAPRFNEFHPNIISTTRFLGSIFCYNLRPPVFICAFQFWAAWMVARHSTLFTFVPDSLGPQTSLYF